MLALRPAVAPGEDRNSRMGIGLAYLALGELRPAVAPGEDRNTGDVGTVASPVALQAAAKHVVTGMLDSESWRKLWIDSEDHYMGRTGVVTKLARRPFRLPDPNGVELLVPINGDGLIPLIWVIVASWGGPGLRAVEAV